MNRSSVTRGVLWIVMLAALVGWIPLIGCFVAGVVGGKKSGGVLNALMASLIPSLVVGNMLVMLAERFVDVPLLGAIVSAGAIGLAFAGVAPIILGALLGGLISDNDGTPVSLPAFAFVSLASAGLALSIGLQVQRATDVLSESTASAGETASILDRLSRAWKSRSAPIHDEPFDEQRGERAGATPPSASRTVRTRRERSAQGSTRTEHWLIDYADPPGDLDFVVVGTDLSGVVYADRIPGGNRIYGSLIGSRIEFTRVSEAGQHWIGEIDASGTRVNGTFTWPGGSQQWTARRR